MSTNIRLPSPLSLPSFGPLGRVSFANVFSWGNHVQADRKKDYPTCKKRGISISFSLKLYHLRANLSTVESVKQEVSLGLCTAQETHSRSGKRSGKCGRCSGYPSVR